VKEGRIVDKKRYWKLSTELSPLRISPDEAIQRFRDLFNTSVQRRLRSDVPVGSSLSGGLDSSSVVASICKNKPDKQHTFSARFTEPGFDEGFFMERLREKIPFESHYVYPAEEGFFSSLQKLFHHQEEPFGSGSIFAQWEVMRTAAENKVTVLLDGQGSDEIMAGYPKYYETFLRELRRSDKELYLKEKAEIENTFGWRGDPEWKRNLESKVPGLVRTSGKIKRTFLPANNFKGLEARFVNRFGRRIPFVNYNYLNQALAYDTTVYGLGKLLRFCDRNSMAFSREVRLPFLSHELVEFVFSLPSSLKIQEGWTKWILRKAMEPELPAEITWRKDKMGFQAPHEKWLLSGGEMLRHYKEKAVARGYIKEEYDDVWKILMTGMLIEMAEGNNGG
jgi:asparagine synthase (glutamine-hydrolysing)